MTEKETRRMIARYKKLDEAQVQALVAEDGPHVDPFGKPVLPGKITPYDGDLTWKISVTMSKWWARGYAGPMPKGVEPMLRLRDRLLGIGGCEACLPTADRDLEKIMRHGQLWTSVPVFAGGRPSHCHEQSAELWYRHRDSCESGEAYVLCTGYALSDDGFWRQHSWVVRVGIKAGPETMTKTVVETTGVDRVAYFGVGLTWADSWDFAAAEGLCHTRQVESA